VAGLAPAARGDVMRDNIIGLPAAPAAAPSRRAGAARGPAK